MLAITSRTAFKQQMQNLYWMEYQFTTISNFDSRIQKLEKVRKGQLYLLYQESKGNLEVIKRWMDYMNLEIPSDTRYWGVERTDFEKRGMDPMEIFNELMRFALMSKNVVSDLLNTDDSVLNKVFGSDSDKNEFLADFQDIFDSKLEHVEACSESCDTSIKLLFNI